jgi:hypothetical protein
VRLRLLDVAPSQETSFYVGYGISRAVRGKPDSVVFS